MLHRDVKPANILLSDPETSSQRIFLADFGIARLMVDSVGLTATNAAIGTMAYASPEQLSGRALDGRSDQYSLACTAYDLLTGSPPFPGNDLIAIVGQHISAPVPPISARVAALEALDSAFAVALAKDPVDRYPSCADFASELSRMIEARAARTEAPKTVASNTVAASSSPTHGGADTPRSNAAVRSDRKGLAVVAAALGFAAVVVGLVIGLSPSNDIGSSPASTAIPSSTSTTTTTTTTTTPPPAAKAYVRVYNVSEVPGAAEGVGNRLREAGWNVTEASNLTLEGVTGTTVFYGATPGEKEAADAVGQVIGAPVQPRVSGLAEQPPGVIVAVTG